MDSQKEALILLDQSLERLEQNIKKIKQDRSFLLLQNKENEEKITSLEQKKDYALKELYTMRDIIAKELNWNIDKTLKKSSSASPARIFMSDSKEES